MNPPTATVANVTGSQTQGSPAQEEQGAPTVHNFTHATPVKLSSAEMWDNMAPRYHKMDPITAAYADAAVRLVADIVVAEDPQTLRVLDIAAGTGVGARAVVTNLYDKFPRMQIHATDISPVMLEKCSERWAADPMTSRVPLTTAVADMQDLSAVPTGSQDLVLVIFGVMFVSDAAKVFSEILRVLAPNGVAVIATWQFHSMTWEVSPALMAHLARLANAPPESVNEDDHLQTILKFGREDVMSRLLRKASIRPGARADFDARRVSGFIEFLRAPPIPMAIKDFTEMYSKPEDASRANDFVRQHFSLDGATVPVRATALTAVFRRAVQSLM